MTKGVALDPPRVSMKLIMLSFEPVTSTGSVGLHAMFIFCPDVGIVCIEGLDAIVIKDGSIIDTTSIPQFDTLVSRS